MHDALLEAIDCGVTEVPARKLRDEYRKLGAVDEERGQTGLEIEFTKLQSSIRTNPVKTFCSLPSNKPKNRYADMEMLPCELPMHGNFSLAYFILFPIHLYLL